MNRWLAIACGLAALITVAHIVGGARDVHVPLLSAQQDAELAAYISVLWHGATASLVLMTLTLAVATTAAQHRAPLSWVAIAISLAFAILFIGYGLTRLESLWIMPQWTIFLAIGAVAIIGVTRRGQTAP